MSKFQQFQCAMRWALIRWLTIPLLAASCGQSSGSSPTPIVGLTPTNIGVASQSAPTTLPVTAGVGEPSYVTANSIEELTIKSDQIAVGHVTETGNNVNMARDVNDISKADPQILALGQIYHFTIDRSLKGVSSPTIDIIQVEGFLVRDPGTDPDSMSQEEIDSARRNYNYVALRLRVSYLVFLVPAVGFQTNQYYVGIVQPWRFDASDEKQVRPESPWTGASLTFLPESLSSIIDRIENPLLKPTSTPSINPYP